MKIDKSNIESLEMLHDKQRKNPRRGKTSGGIRYCIFKTKTNL
jgi:hypothetical protein